MSYNQKSVTQHKATLPLSNPDIELGREKTDEIQEEQT